MLALPISVLDALFSAKLSQRHIPQSLFPSVCSTSIWGDSVDLPNLAVDPNTLKTTNISELAWVAYSAGQNHPEVQTSWVIPRLPTNAV